MGGHDYDREKAIGMLDEAKDMATSKGKTWSIIWHLAFALVAALLSISSSIQHLTEVQDGIYQDGIGVNPS